MKTLPLNRNLRAAAFFVMGVFVTGCCSLSDPDVDPDKEEGCFRAYSEETATSTVKMSENTIFIKGNISHDLQSFDSESGTITFANSDGLMLSEIKVGDILYSTDRTEITPDGYCLRVIAVDDSGDCVTYRTEPATIFDAIDYYKETNVLSAGNYKPEDIHVYALPIGETNDTETRATASWETGEGVEIKGDKMNFKSDGKETSFDVVVWEDKASGDVTSGKFQVKLGIKVQHEFLNEDTESLTEIKDGNIVLFAMARLGVGVTVEIGNKFSLLTSTKEPEDMTEEERVLYERQKTLEDMAKASLVGKRFRLLDIPLNYTCTKVIIDPRFVVYGEFKLDLSGKLVIETGIENGVYALNIANDGSDFKKLSYLRRVTRFNPYFRIKASISFTAQAGFGLGLNFEIPGLPVKKDSYIGPSAIGVWFGFEFSEKIKVAWTKDVLSGKTEIKATGEDGELSCQASISGIAGIKKHAVEIDWIFWEKELITLPGWEWSMYVSTPSPYDLHAEVDGSSVDLSWKVPDEGMLDEIRINVANTVTGETLSNWKSDYSGTTARFGPAIDGTYFWNVETVSSAKEHFPSDTCSFVINASTVTTGVPEKNGDIVTVPVEVNTLNNVLERGVVYSTERNEPLADVDTECHYGGSDNVFNLDIAGMQQSVTYYMRGYTLISVDGGARYLYGNTVEYFDQVVPTTITVTPSEIDFGMVEYGTSKSEMFTVKNMGKGTAKFSVACESHENVFEVNDGGAEFTLAEGASMPLTVTAHGMKRGYSASCDIRVVSDAENGTQTLSVQAEGWDNRPLTLETTSKTLKVGDTDRVDILFGSLEYELFNEAPAVVRAIISTEGGGGGGWYDHWTRTEKYVNLEALSAGTATLTVTDRERNEQVILVVTVTEGGASVPVPEAVDLGLPSGLKWASFNLGASKPEEYGDYFAWGETEPKNDYSWATYKWCKGSGYTLTKYCPSDDSYYWGGPGSPDNKRSLADYDYEDDAARANWGGEWRMPTYAEFQELINNCDYEWSILNGVNGCLITSKKNGNSIFLPAAGHRGDTSVYGAESYGWYWTSIHSPYNPCKAWYLDFYSPDFDFDMSYYYYRYYGQSVRPVIE